MKLKKLAALMLAGAMVLGLTACGGSGSDSSSNSSDSSSSSSSSSEEASDSNDAAAETPTEGVTNLVLWTWNDDALTFAKKFNETHDNIQVEAINVAASGEYETKVQTALLGGETEPDIIGAEPGWITMFMEAGFFANLDDFGAKDYEGVQVDYVWQEG